MTLSYCNSLQFFFFTPLLKKCNNDKSLPNASLLGLSNSRLLLPIETFWSRQVVRKMSSGTYDMCKCVLIVIVCDKMFTDHRSQYWKASHTSH